MLIVNNRNVINLDLVKNFFKFHNEERKHYRIYFNYIESAPVYMVFQDEKAMDKAFAAILLHYKVDEMVCTINWDVIDA